MPASGGFQLLDGKLRDKRDMFGSGRTKGPTDAEAQYRLGNRYLDGIGVTRSREDAAIWWRKAADQGHADAQARLGIFYFKGLGVPHDISEAIRLWKKAAAGGSARAQFQLGRMYIGGMGVPGDRALGFAWLTLARETCRYTHVDRISDRVEAEWAMHHSFLDSSEIERAKAIAARLRASVSGHPR